MVFLNTGQDPLERPPRMAHSPQFQVPRTDNRPALCSELTNSESIQKQQLSCIFLNLLKIISSSFCFIFYSNSIRRNKYFIQLPLVADYSLKHKTVLIKLIIILMIFFTNQTHPECNICNSIAVLIHCLKIHFYPGYFLLKFMLKNIFIFSTLLFFCYLNVAEICKFIISFYK